MPSVVFSYLILGVVVASAFGNEQKNNKENYTTPITGNDSTSTFSSTTVDIASTPATSCINQNCYSTDLTDITRIPDTTSNDSSTYSTIKPSTATTKGDTDVKSTMSSTTPQTTVPSKRTSPTTTTKDKGTSNEQGSGGGNQTGIIILVVIILVIILLGAACFFTKRRARRYSVDPTFRHDEANIPLSTVDPELPVDASSQNGLQTFESTEPASIEPQEPGAKPEVQAEQKTEADKSVVDPTAETAAPIPSADTSEDKPKEVVAEQSPPAPVEPSVEEKTDDEDLVSNKTSVESLKETNENNSNNADSMAGGLKLSNMFWDVPLDSPV